MTKSTSVIDRPPAKRNGERSRKLEGVAFKNLLHGFIQNVRVHWKGEFPTVYHPEFQKIVEEIFAEK